nr:hypothetical protein CFP56_07737 [Quercus suber]
MLSVPTLPPLQTGTRSSSHTRVAWLYEGELRLGLVLPISESGRATGFCGLKVGVVPFLEMRKGWTWRQFALASRSRNGKWDKPLKSRAIAATITTMRIAARLRPIW